MNVLIPEDCGSSPRKRFIADFNRAFAEVDIDFVLDHVSDDIVWDIVGGKKISGKTSMRNEMESMIAGQASAMVLHSIITHDGDAASNGYHSEEHHLVRDKRVTAP